jgi:hypothetical protein
MYTSLPGSPITVPVTYPESVSTGSMSFISFTP